MRFFKKRFTKTPYVLIVLGLLTLTVHSFMLSRSFKRMDDQVSIVNNADIKNFSRAGAILRKAYFGDHSYYRPLVNLSYMIEYRLYGLNAFYYYLTNVFIHTATAVVIFFLILVWGQDRLTAFGVSLLFAIHPVHWEAVSNISGRSILLCAFFYLSAFLCFCLFFTETTPRPICVRKRKFYYIGSVFLFMLALLCKESAAMLPILLAAYAWGLEGKPVDEKRRSWVVLAPFFIVFGLYLVIRHWLGITEVFPWRSVPEGLLGFMTFLRAVLTFLRLFVLPIDLHFDRSRVVFSDFFDSELLMTLLVFGMAGLGLFKFRRRIPRKALFFLFWFGLELAPVSQVITTIGVQPGYISTAEHFLYLPSVSMLTLMVLGLRWVYQKTVVDFKTLSRGMFCCLTAGLYLYFFVAAIQQNIYSRVELSMLEQSLLYDPWNVRLRNSLGLLYASNHRFREAEEQFRRVVDFDPADARARIGLGKSLIDQGRYWQGIEEYEKVLDAGNLKAVLEDNLISVYALLIKRYEDVIAREQGNAKAHYSLGVVYSKGGRIEEAVVQYQKAVELEPDFKNALFNLAASYGMLGDSEGAIVYFEKTLALDGPQDELDTQASFHLKRLYAKRALTHD